MKRRPSFLFAVGLFLVLVVFSGCDLSLGSGEYGSFEYSLRGTWIENAGPDTLEIDFDSITIDHWGTGTPLDGYTKNIPLRAYAEDNHIYISDKGSWQAGIPYILWNSGGYPVTKMLTLQRSGFPSQTFQKLPHY
jgi:hypothetical protein